MNKLIVLSLLCALFMGVSARAQNKNVANGLYLRGWVCDTANVPLADVQVKIADSRYIAATDSTGRYSLGPVSAGRYIVVVQKNGYVSLIDENVSISATTDFYKHNFRMSAGIDAVPESLLVPRYGILEGLVSGRKGKERLSKAMVTIMGTRLRLHVRNDGSYRAPRVPIGSHNVEVEAIGYTTRVYNDVVIGKNSVTELRAVLDVDTVSDARYIRYKPPMIHPDQTGSAHSYSAEEINKLPGH